MMGEGGRMIGNESEIAAAGGNPGANGSVIYSVGVRVAAWILCFVMAIVTIGSLIAIIFMAKTGFYTSSYEAVYKENMEDLLKERCYSVLNHYLNNWGNVETLYEYSNFYFTITLDDGTVVAGTYDGREALYSYTREYKPDLTADVNDAADENDVTDENGVTGESGDMGAEDRLPSETPEENDRLKQGFTVQGYIPTEMEYTDEISLVVFLIETGFRYKIAVCVIGALSLILGFALFIFLLCAAGHVRGRAGITLRAFDKIPLDLLAVGVLFVNMICITDPFVSSDMGEFILFVLLCAFDFNMLLGFCVSISARVKAGTLLRSTLIWIIVAFLLRCVRKMYRAAVSFSRNLSILWKTVVGIIAAFFWIVIMVAIGANNPAFVFFLWFLIWCAASVVAVIITMSLHKIKKGGEMIAAGNLEYKINTTNMTWEFKNHADALNRIGDGMSLALEERMRSERFRTELITNVSHDLKTPLTSIINYIDLMKKEEPESERIKSYIDVLERQASRLRKLTEDLVDASKASTGNLSIELVRCELGELISQTAGEYEERLYSASLELISHKPDEPVFVMADGRHLSRIIDNLMSNISKYAQPSTRVYLNLEKKGNKAVITFRNTSKYALNISSGELMERFVRGDASRHTEGSGLGLSIARSLVELQHGEMEVIVDGDLFKVILIFDIK